MANDNELHLYGAITKFDALDDSLMVSGILSTPKEDNAGEVVDPEAMRKALGDFLVNGTSREMHQPIAAGKPIAAHVDEQGNTHVTVKVIDKGTIQKIREGVLKGFSIGGKQLKKVGNKITELLLRDASLVDVPCNPDCVFTIVKFDKPGDHCSDPQCKNHVEGHMHKCSSCMAKAHIQDNPPPDLFDGEHKDTGDDFKMQKMHKCDHCGMPKTKCDCTKPDEEIHKDFDSHHDHKARYGDVDYADEELHKYPIDTKAHVRAAWSYVNMPKNQHGASHSRISHIKSKIRAAAEKHGVKIKDESTEKAMSAEAIQKLDALAATVAELAKTVETISKQAPALPVVDGKPVDIAKVLLTVDTLQKQAEATQKKVDDNERESIIRKMDADGRVAFNPSTSVAYTAEELGKLPIEILKFAAINSAVVPLKARAIYKGDQKAGAIDPKLKGSDRIEKSWENQYGNSVAELYAKHGLRSPNN